MLKILPIIPSSTSQKFLPIILILFSYHNLLFSYYSFALNHWYLLDIKVSGKQWHERWVNLRKGKNDFNWPFYLYH